MNLLIMNLRIAGMLMIALALFHTLLPGRFKWKEEFAPLTLLSRQIMYVHTFFIALIVLLMGVLCAVYADELIKPGLAMPLACGLLLFWGLRGFFQLFVFSAALWKGKTFETRVHLFFSALWLYFSAVFLWLVLSY